jgi:hypothetical protein
MAESQTLNLVDSRHPGYLSGMTDWAKWRLSYNGGDEFREAYLERFSMREDPLEFNARKAMTPIPKFAGAAINDIRNAIYQRMRDITRKGGSKAYQYAVNGNNLGVDRRGATMNAFIGVKVLTELLVMGRVGVFVDAPPVPAGATLADIGDVAPYLYKYDIEDILSWTCSKPEAPSEFDAILLRDSVMQYDQAYFLPTISVQRYRYLRVNPDTGKVGLQFYDLQGQPVDQYGQPGGEIQLELDRIPFVMLDIGSSLIKDVCQHQIALLNLGSSDVSYALRSNFPFYVEQKDLRAVGAHLKHAATAEGTATTGGQGAGETDIKVGATHGRAYDKGMNPPGFINPSAEPLRASLELQDRLKRDIRELVNLAVSALAVRASAESKAMDNQGLEAGLSYIGLLLESAERQLCEHWAAYEERTVTKREVATIKYPDRYSLKTDADRIKEAQDLTKLMNSVPGRKVKRELSKGVVQALLGGKIGVDDLDAINQEIDSAHYTNSDPTTIIQAVQAGLVGEKTGSVALGFDDDEYLAARQDHLERVKRIAEAQGMAGGQHGRAGADGGGGDPAARGVPDLSANTAAGADEKTASRNTDLEPTTASRVRGAGKPKLA